MREDIVWYSIHPLILKWGCMSLWELSFFKRSNPVILNVKERDQAKSRNVPSLNIYGTRVRRGRGWFQVCSRTCEDDPGPFDTRSKGPSQTFGSCSRNTEGTGSAGQPRMNRSTNVFRFPAHSPQWLFSLTGSLVLTINSSLCKLGNTETEGLYLLCLASVNYTSE